MRKATTMQGWHFLDTDKRLGCGEDCGEGCAKPPLNRDGVRGATNNSERAVIWNRESTTI